ncbi:hypothetical protein [Myxococcus hansupus]|uniref:hypothetical protein n=1 Tax=Pseudomyxococcus hansupus TaxID=1297742 RepID=UPI0005D11CC6|nr:hypothetical protein [Myxococcus hansupus]
MSDSNQGAIMDVPVGVQHLVHVHAYDSSGLKVHTGASTVDVIEGGRRDVANVFMPSLPQKCPEVGTELPASPVDWIRSPSIVPAARQQSLKE